MVITAPEYTKDLSLLLVRVMVGISFLVAARNKNRDIRKFAKSHGLPVPVAWGVMCVEFVSALMFIFGVYAQVAAIAIMILMLGTTRLHVFKWKSPYWAQQGGWEYDVMLFTLAAVILVFGAGALAIIS